MGIRRVYLTAAAAAMAAPAAAPLIAAIAAVAGLSLAIAAWTLWRRRAATGAEAEAPAHDLDRLEVLLATSPDGFYVWHSDGGETCSERLAAWLGTTPQAVTGFSDLEPNFESDGFARLGRAVARLRAEGAPFSLALETADGGRALAATGAEARAPAGGPRAHVLWLHDVTAERAEAQPLAAAAAEAAAAKAAAAKAAADRDEAGAELRRHIEAHAEVLESLTTAIAVFGADQRLKFFNSAFASMWRLDEDWLATEPPQGETLDLLHERRRLPEVADFSAFKKERLDLYASLVEPLEEFRHLPDGTTLRMRISPHPLGGLLYFFEDITDRLELERARNTLIAVKRATLDNLHEGVAVFGADGRLKLYNPSYARIWQLDEEMLASEPHVGELVELVKPLVDFGGDWDRYMARAVASATDRRARVKRLERPDGLVIDYACVPLPDGNMLNTYLDVTDSIRIERALRERAEALETADRLTSEFLANISYEFRSPLTTIVGFAEILTNEYFGSLNQRQKEYTDGIVSSSHHLLDLINDILDLATIDAGRMALELGSFDLHATLASVLELMRERAFRQDLSIEFDCPPDIGHIEADERRVKQVLFNLLSNAMKFVASGGTITLGARRDGSQVELWVADTGFGIPPDEQQQIFGRFHKGSGQTGRAPGAGLGLSLVKSFVELHGGRVELESTPGTGTRVSCYLPASAQATAPRAAAAGAA